MSKEIYEKNLCENIKLIRKRNLHSRKDMSENLGISVHSLAMIESGKIPKRLTVDVLFSIEETYGISCVDLFKKDDVDI